jgi:hypothetical protein
MKLSQPMFLRSSMGSSEFLSFIKGFAEQVLLVGKTYVNQKGFGFFWPRCNT